MNTTSTNTTSAHGTRTPAVKAAATRNRILAAAARTLSLKGYSATRLADIAERAGVRPPAVYYYFSSREELIAEVMAVGQLRLREHVETALAALPDDTPPMDRICAAVEAHLRVELDLSDFATAVSRNSGQLPEDIRARLRADSGAYFDLWRDLLARARAAGAIRNDIDLRAARMLVMGALNWTPEWWNPRQGSLTGVIRTAQSLVRHGLGVP
ncbi:MULTISPECIES: TetR/AcrR family transcriptional regulator [unclassified Streptomyces]|uniref:TetR/AcrR family transcriptional regulator n=1 Tax=unclassified Streptomyces TaxID=2593676 RepID=UPI002E75E5A4|nr:MULTISPECIES: TetR/AcrR family transcriptional regulator [unclassified Streptomyces]MEE1764898.1 TetR/AcrR family transcriptional regulator [Streptomyces sp. SP18BB07]MEE1831687.1 TetR/AcrR family transcriptional regulator [Streptomyces sp. SP17KL33]